MFERKTIQAAQKGALVEITDVVEQVVENSGIREGVAVVTAEHADASILCTSFYDPKGHEDIIDDFNRIWPARDDFQCDAAPALCAAYGKAAVAGQTMDFIVNEGKLKLGGSQGIFFAEYQQPRERTYTVKVVGV